MQGSLVKEELGIVVPLSMSRAICSSIKKEGYRVREYSGFDGTIFPEVFT